MNIKYYALTDKGCVRDTNEDSILCGELLVNYNNHFKMEKVIEQEISDIPVWFAVADGMGGQDAGEIASRLTLEKLLVSFKKDSNAIFENSEKLKAIITGIHDEVNAFGVANNTKGMGSTLVGAIFNKNKFIVFNVGDSRLYISRDGYLSQKTKDHSLIEQFGGNVPKNYITSSIGGGTKDITIDIFDLTGKIKNNDLIMICSDGLTDFDMDKHYDEFETLIDKSKDDLMKLNEDLVKFAIDNGSADNISIITIRNYD